jgi:hypothetical protein
MVSSFDPPAPAIKIGLPIRPDIVAQALRPFKRTSGFPGAFGSIRALRRRPGGSNADCKAWLSEKQAPGV